MSAAQSHGTGWNVTAPSFHYAHAVGRGLHLSATPDRVVSLLPMAAEHMQEHGMPQKFRYIPNEHFELDEWTVDDAPLPQEHRDVTVAAQARRAFSDRIRRRPCRVRARQPSSCSTPRNHFNRPRCASSWWAAAPKSGGSSGSRGKWDWRTSAFLPPVPKRLMPSLLPGVRCLLSRVGANPLWELGVSPNKLLGFMMAGKPDRPRHRAGNDLVAEAGGGLASPPRKTPVRLPTRSCRCRPSRPTCRDGRHGECDGPSSLPALGPPVLGLGACSGRR